MSSAINSIYTAIAAWAPTYKAGVTTKVWTPAKIVSTLSPASCPLRILTITEGGESGEEGNFIALGKTFSVTWLITDLFLLRAVAHVPAHRDDVDKALIDYQASYLDAVITDRSPTSQSHILRVSMYPGVIRWPTMESDPYFGVRCVLEIQEFI